MIESRVRRTYIRDRRIGEQRKAFDAFGARLQALTAPRVEGNEVTSTPLDRRSKLFEIGRPLARRRSRLVIGQSSAPALRRPELKAMQDRVPGDVAFTTEILVAGDLGKK